MTTGRFTIGYAQSTTPSLKGEREIYLAGFDRNRIAQTSHRELLLSI